MRKEVMTSCDWCLQEALVQTIDENLWRFWKIISTEDPIMTSHKNICDICKSRYEGFSIYIQRCKINTSKVGELLSRGQVKHRPSIDVEYPPLIKKEISDELDLSSCRPAVSSGVFIEEQMLAGCSNSPMKIPDSTIDKLLTGKVKKEPLIDIEDHYINEEGICEEDSSDRDYPTASEGKGKDGLVLCVVLERLVLPDSMVLQKKVNNNLTCIYCRRTFNLLRKLKIHLRTHTGDKPYKCSQCNKSFAQSSYLNRHLRTHTGMKPYKCSQCNKSFAQQSYLTVHLRTHTGMKPYKCSHCNKSFAQPGYLKRHLHTHTSKKPYKCSHCNKSFALPSYLNVHLRTHTSKKPYKCSQCNKSFAQSSYLNRHLRTHTVKKRYKCLHCNKSFAQSNHLNLHLRTHTGKKPYKCSNILV